MDRKLYVYARLGSFIDFGTLLEDENPGIGGTEFVSIKLALLLAATYPNRDISLVTDSIELSNTGNLGGRLGVENWKQWRASQSDCVIVSNQQFRDSDVALSVLEAGRLIGWSHHPFDRNFRTSKIKNFHAVVSPGVFAVHSNRLIGIRSVHIPHPTLPPRSAAHNTYATTGSVNYVYMSSGLAIKGFWDIIQIWQKLSRDSSGATLHVIGSIPFDIAGSTRHRLASFLVDQVKGGRIVLYGPTRAGKNELLGQMHIGLLNPRGLSESFPATAIEFMAAGLPLVSSAKHGNYESMRLFPETTGFSNRSIARIASEISRDPTKLQELSVRAKTSAADIHKLGPEVAKRWLSLVDCDEQSFSSRSEYLFWKMRAPKLRVALGVAGLLHYKLRLKRKWRRLDNRHQTTGG